MYVDILLADNTTTKLLWIELKLYTAKQEAHGLHQSFEQQYLAIIKLAKKCKILRIYYVIIKSPCKGVHVCHFYDKKKVIDDYVLSLIATDPSTMGSLQGRLLLKSKSIIFTICYHLPLALCFKKFQCHFSRMLCNIRGWNCRILKNNLLFHYYLPLKKMLCA